MSDDKRCVSCGEIHDNAVTEDDPEEMKRFAAVLKKHIPTVAKAILSVLNDPATTRQDCEAIVGIATAKFVASAIAAQDPDDRAEFIADWLRSFTGSINLELEESFKITGVLEVQAVIKERVITVTVPTPTSVS
jgi:peroxiredoxin